MLISVAELSDLQEILDLQYLAYQSEAALLNNFSIAPLTQTLSEVEHQFENGIILKAVDEDGIIRGSVRAYVKNDTLHIGKLIVHPDFQGNGIGTALLTAIENACPQKRCELFTSDKSIKNILLYERLGYTRYKEHEDTSGLRLVYLQKQLRI